MQWLELHNVEYGECIVLGGKRQEILMVDCGSMNQHVRDGEIPLELRYETIGNRYARCMDRYFLLTHYHRDHLSGFKKLLEADEGYFSRVFLPCTPKTAQGTAPMLEFALFAYLFLPPQTDCSQVNTSCVKIFRLLEKKVGSERIFTLRAGDSFPFDDVTYQVLWPKAEDFPFEPELLAAAEELTVRFSSPFLPELEQSFLALKEKFVSLYLRCCDAFSASGRALPEQRATLLSELDEALAGLEAMKNDLNASPLAHDVREILQNTQHAAAYSNCTNAASVIFQNLREREAGFQDILMTGDAPPEILEGLADQLFDGYYILKAPHHGTASGYSTMFRDMAIAHILISNGEYHAGGGIAQEYVDMQDSVRHCTNCSPCKWYRASNACCNRLCYCYDQPHPGLVIKCPAAVGVAGQEAGCRIRVVGHAGEKACLCE